MYHRSRPWQCVSVSYCGCLCSSTSLRVIIQNDVISLMHPHSPSDLLMVHAVCGTHTHSERHWLITVMLTLAVWHDPRISRPPQLERPKIVRLYASIYGITLCYVCLRIFDYSVYVSSVHLFTYLTLDPLPLTSFSVSLLLHSCMQSVTRNVSCSAGGWWQSDRTFYPYSDTVRRSVLPNYWLVSL